MYSKLETCSTFDASQIRAAVCLVGYSSCQALQTGCGMSVPWLCCASCSDDAGLAHCNQQSCDCQAKSATYRNKNGQQEEEANSSSAGTTCSSHISIPSTCLSPPEHITRGHEILRTHACIPADNSDDAIFMQSVLAAPTAPILPSRGKLPIPPELVPPDF